MFQQKEIHTILGTNSFIPNFNIYLLHEVEKC